MLIYQKYIFKKLSSTFLIISGTMVGVTWITQSIRYLDFIIIKGAKVYDFLLIIIHLLPYILFIIMPITVYLTVTYVFKRMLLDKELTILYSFAISKQKIIKIFVWFTFILVLLQYLISIFAIPLSSEKLKNIKLNIDKKALINLLVVNKFIAKINGVTIYIGKKESNNVLKDIFIFDSRKTYKSMTFVAQSGQFIKQNEDFILELNAGSILEHYPNKAKSLAKFNRYKIILNSFTSSTNTRIKDPNEYTIHELLFAKNFPTTNILRYRSYGHFRLLWPPLTLTICVPTLLILSYNIPRNKGLKVLDFLSLIMMLLSVILFVLFYILSYKSERFVILMYLIGIISPIVLIIKTYTIKER